MKTEDGILMIEPAGEASSTPLIDELTRKMTAAWRKQRDSDIAYRGMHFCKCGAISDNKDHYIGGDAGAILTNSLCVHYLAFHRGDVPAVELDKVRSLTFGEAEPSKEELAKPN